jgi:putative SOS response-associated peptidase YedK
VEAKGKPVDFKELLRKEPDKGTTNIRRLDSKHWTRWLGREHRCIVPLTSFSEFDKAAGLDVWFALDGSRPLACFAGLWTNWTSRKAKRPTIYSASSRQTQMRKSMRSIPRRCP